MIAKAAGVLATGTLARSSSLVAILPYSRTPDEPKKRGENDMPTVIVCATCMAAGRRLFRYLTRYAPDRRFVAQGERNSLDALCLEILDKLDWTASVPKHRKTVDDA